MGDPGELVVVAAILGLFGALAAGGWYVAKVRPARLARLRDAPSISLESIGHARVLVVLFAGMILTGASAPAFMAAFPKTPLMFLATIVLAFAAVLAPLTFARPFTVEARLFLEPLSLRIERRGAPPVVVDLARPFALEAQRVDNEVLVLVAQEGVRILFGYRHRPALAHLPSSAVPRGWIEENERVTFFGEEAAVLHERLQTRARARN
jgi:hypothetical protein